MGGEVSIAFAVQCLRRAVAACLGIGCTQLRLRAYAVQQSCNISMALGGSLPVHDAVVAGAPRSMAILLRAKQLPEACHKSCSIYDAVRLLIGSIVRDPFPMLA